MTNSDYRTEYVIRERVALSDLHQEKIASLAWGSDRRINANSPLFRMGLVERYTVTGPRGGVRRFHRLTAAGRVVVDRINDEAEGVDGRGRHIILVDTLPAGMNDGDRCDDHGNRLVSLMSLDELEHRADELNGHGVEAYAGERAVVMKAYDDRRAFNRAAADMTPATAVQVHFHHSDGRFCGSEAPSRQFTFDYDRVTCRRCKHGSAKDRMELTEKGAQYLAELAAAAEQRTASVETIRHAVARGARCVVPILLAVVAMVSTACTSPMSLSDPSPAALGGVWATHGGGFDVLTMRLDDAGNGVATGVLSNCTAGCTVTGTVSKRPQDGDGVALGFTFAGGTDASFTGHVDGGDALSGALTVRPAALATASAPAGVTFHLLGQ